MAKKRPVVTPDIAGSVRSRRDRLGLSLNALALRSGVSAGMLSDLERGRKSPTIRTLCQIAEGLACTVTDLLGERRPRRRELIRPKARPTVRDAKTGVARSVLSSLLAREGVELLWYALPPKTSTGRFPAHKHGVYENVTVIRGRLEHSLGKDVTQLSQGDSLSYAADDEHELRNPGRATCECLVVIDSTRVAPR